MLSSDPALFPARSPSTGKISFWALEGKVLNLIFSQEGKAVTREEILTQVNDLIKRHGWDPGDFRAKKVDISEITSPQDDSNV